MNYEKWVSIKIDGTTISTKGYFCYRECKSGKDSIELFANEYLNGKADFNELYGAFIFEMQLKDNRTMFFADNSGMMRFFVDMINIKISDDLDELVGDNSRTLDYNSVAQILYFGCTYDLHTIVDGVLYNDPLKYYYINQESKKIEVQDKKLLALSDKAYKSKRLANIMTRFCDNYSSEAVACTITGGTDSRSVLAHLLHNNVSPILLITGTKEADDVKIAQQIAEKIDKEIEIIEIDEDKGDLTPEMIDEIAGLTEPMERYRLLKKAMYLKKRGVNIECGGVAGEMYKNSFINQEYPFYNGMPNWKKFYKYKVAAWDFPMEICGKNLIDSMKDIENYTLKSISNNQDSKKSAYLIAGYYMLQCRFAPISILESKYYIPYNPLLERKMAAYSLRENPYRLEGQAFQRFQVSKYFPLIKDIKTDRGLSLNYKKRNIESLRGSLFLVRVYINRLFHRKKVSLSSQHKNIWMASKEYKDALETCKSYGIISQEIVCQEVRSIILDRVFSVGRFIQKHNFKIERSEKVKNVNI